MPLTLLEMVKQFANEIGATEPQLLFGAYDDLTKNYLALAIREGKEFSRRANGIGGWQALHKEHTFTTVSGQDEYDLPSDFESFIARTFWDGASSWEMIGPILPAEKQLIKYGVTPVLPRRKFYVKGNKFVVVPTPETTGETLVFDYFSNAWCQSSSGAAQSTWLLDTDTYKLDEDCFILGLKWRWLRSKGMDYSVERQDYERQCAIVMSRDTPPLDLNLSGGSAGFRLLSTDNIPDTGYGS